MTHRSCLRWKPTGKIFKIVGLRWVPTGKIFTSSTTKVDSEPQNGSNDDITNQYECKQTRNVSVGLVPQRQKASDYDNLDPAPELKNVSSSADTTVPSQQELDLLFGPLYDEFFNDGTSRVNKSSSPTDNSAPQDTHPSTNIHPTSEPSTPTNVHAEENNDNQAEFTNPFYIPIFLQRYQVYQGRLLASFQDDAKYEHVGQDTRSQGLFPSCFVIFDLGAFVHCLLTSSLSLRSLNLLRLTISLDRLISFKEDTCYIRGMEHVVMNPTSAGNEASSITIFMYPEINIVDSMNFLDWFPAQSARIFYTQMYLDLPCLLRSHYRNRLQADEHGKSESS
ncbi:hypothetical protein Tco_1079665 [Tanacetum coccineum]|uniref:Uncharacterized protein n=1 Tax=Tanacetum coccineum TaxID=301880 RepID=A0ABQ5HSJ2_9ASTR